jgi:hypothetical protein
VEEGARLGSTRTTPRENQRVQRRDCGGGEWEEIQGRREATGEPCKRAGAIAGSLSVGRVEGGWRRMWVRGLEKKK